MLATDGQAITWAHAKRTDALARRQATARELGEEWSESELEGGYHPICIGRLLEVWDQYRAGDLRFADVRLVLAVLARTGLPWSSQTPLRAVDLRGLARVAPCALAAALRRLQRAQVLEVNPPGELQWIPVESERLRRHACAQTPYPEREVPVPRRLLRRLADAHKPSRVATVLGHLVRGLWMHGKQVAVVGRVRLGWIAHRFGCCERSVRAAHQELLRLGWIVSLSDPQCSTAEDRALDGPRFAFNPFGIYPALEPPQPRSARTSAPVRRTAARSAVLAPARSADPAPEALAVAAPACGESAGGGETEFAGGSAIDFAPPKEHSDSSEISSELRSEEISRNHDHSDPGHPDPRDEERARACEDSASGALPSHASSHGALASPVRSNRKPQASAPASLAGFVIERLEPERLTDRPVLERVFESACASGRLASSEAGWLTLVSLAVRAQRLWREGRLRNPGGWLYDAVRYGRHEKIQLKDEEPARRLIARWRGELEVQEASAEPAPTMPERSAPQARALSLAAARVLTAAADPREPQLELERALEADGEGLHRAQLQAALCEALGALSECSAADRSALTQLAWRALEPALHRAGPVRLLDVYKSLRTVLGAEELARCTQALVHAAARFYRQPKGAERARPPAPVELSESRRARVRPGELTVEQVRQALRDLVLVREEYPLEERKRLGNLAWDRLLRFAQQGEVVDLDRVHVAVEQVMSSVPLARAG